MLFLDNRRLHRGKNKNFKKASQGLENARSLPQ